MELNERENTIVNLINNLAEVASDETTTQESIDRILAKIKRTTAENIKKEMAKVGQVEHPMVDFPNGDVAESMRSTLDGEREKMVRELMSELKNNRNDAVPHEQLVFTRIREVKAPCKAHPTDAGIDFFVPDAKAWTEEYKSMIKAYSKNVVMDGVDGVKFDGDNLVVCPNAHVAIPSGIKTIIPQGLAMMMVNKSGVATKLKLDHSACLIDSEYRDELIFCFFNHSVTEVRIEPGMKITQGLIVPVIDLQLQEVLNCVYDDMGKDTDRGGGFGSSGN